MPPAVNGPRRARISELCRALIVIALVAGCGSTAPTTSVGPTTSSASPSLPATPGSTAPASGSPQPAPSDEAAVYAAINSQVQAIRGLAELSPVTPTLVSSAQLNEVVHSEVTAETPPTEIATSERLYKAMGLLAPDASLSALIDSLLESEVAGLYVPASKSLYVLSKGGQAGPVERFYYSHEYDHALQDQHFDLQAFTKGFDDDSDGALARQALVEGDAYVAMTLWMQQNMSPGDMMAVLAAGLDPRATAALASIPKIVQAQLLFAATQGTQFVLGLQTGGGWAAVDRAWAHPPRSTEQILHADKFAADEVPIDVTLPADLPARMGTGWSLRIADTLGEYQTQVWLEDAGKLGQGIATAAAAGWGGDRIELLEGPAGAWALAFHSVWDTTADASEFEQAAESIAGALRQAGDSAQVLPGEGGRNRWIVAASDAPSLAKLANVLGLAG